ncbi:MAG: DUF3362 domain-containing protein, partial [Oscillospiraceae bacterium]|nr:DUF3362 domain-containing protein [Oscillospiraceae bacterium]
TASTVMYYTGINPLDGKAVYVPTDYHEKQLQRALLQYNRPDNADLVREALRRAGREDLIGNGKDCLVRPASHGKPAAQRPSSRTAPHTKGRKDDRKATAPSAKKSSASTQKPRTGEGRKNRHR